MKEEKVGGMAMGYWSDLPTDPVISIAARLSDPGDYARFRTVCRSWESAVRGFRPSFFPWLAAIPKVHGDPPNQEVEVSFISHASEDSVYKRPLLCDSNIFFNRSWVSSAEDGRMVFVRKDGRVPIIVNPLTGAGAQPMIQQEQSLPSLFTLLECHPIESITFLPDNNVIFVECTTKYDYHILAAATPGDDEWSTTRVSWLRGNSSIVFHKTDNKFYILNRNGNMQSFCLTRRRRRRVDGGRRKTTVFEKVSSTLAKSTREWDTSSIDSRLMFDGTNLLQVRKIYPSNIFDALNYKFDILKYDTGADAWVKMTDMDFGNNAVFFDSYGARMLPLPLSHHQREDEGVRRNCIYFTNFQRTEEDGQCIHYVGMYDVGKGTAVPSFSPINLQPNHNLSLFFMWFTPSLSIKN